LHYNGLAELSLFNRYFRKIDALGVSTPQQIFHIAMAKITAGEKDKVYAENAVRTAAKSAARGAPLSEAFLSKIVAETSDTSLSIADRVLRAATMAEQYVTSPKAINTISATPQEIAAQAAAMSFASSRVAGSAAQLADNSGRGSSKGGYQTLGNSDPRWLQAVTSASFAGSSFAAVGLDFGMVSYLRSQDRTFTPQNVLNAANDSKALGFSSKDRAAMFDHTTIDRYDPKARTTNKALQDYQERIEGDDELCDLHKKAKHAKTPEERKALNKEIAEKRARHAKETGLNERITDPKNPTKSVAATKRRKTAVEKKAELNYERRAEARTSSTPPKLVASQASADLLKKLKAPSPR
jgi:hypothetical protein